MSKESLAVRVAIYQGLEWGTDGVQHRLECSTAIGYTGFSSGKSVWHACRNDLYFGISIHSLLNLQHLFD